MIRAQNVSYRYPQSDAPAIAEFSAQFPRGEISAVSGKNGCGKTTLTKLLAGVLRPTAGQVTIDGVDSANLDLFEIGQRIGYVFQNPNRQLFCDTVYNEIAFGLRNSGFDETETEGEVSRYLELFKLETFRDTYPGRLSHGEKQRLALAAVLALGTGFLVLDEPTTGLDVGRKLEFGSMLLNLRRELNCGIVFVSHDSGFIARFADRELVMTL